MSKKMVYDSETWLAIFQEKTEQLEQGDSWELTIHDQMEEPDAGWMKYTVNASAGFRCSKCRRWWSSAHVLILFHLTLKRHQKQKGRRRKKTCKKQGFVRMRVFKQECKHCSGGWFEEPEFTCEAIEVVLNKLLNRIRMKCYGEKGLVQTNFAYGFQGRNDGPHETEHCEACHLGLCDRGEPIYEESNSVSEQESIVSSDSRTSSKAKVFTHIPRYTSSPSYESPTYSQPAAVNLRPWSGPWVESPSWHSSDGSSLGSQWEIPPYEENYGLHLRRPPDKPAGGRKMRWVVLAITVGAILWWSFRRSTNGKPSNVLSTAQDTVHQGVAMRIIPTFGAESTFFFMSCV